MIIDGKGHQWVCHNDILVVFLKRAISQRSTQKLEDQTISYLKSAQNKKCDGFSHTF